MIVSIRLTRAEKILDMMFCQKRGVPLYRCTFDNMIFLKAYRIIGRGRIHAHVLYEF